MVFFFLNYDFSLEKGSFPWELKQTGSWLLKFKHSTWVPCKKVRILLQLQELWMD